MLFVLLAAMAAAVILLYRGFGLLAWLLGTGIALVGWRLTGIDSPKLFIALVSALIMLALLFGVPLIRRHVLSRMLMRRMAKVLPRLGNTERIALEAGTVWWDADLFGGRPDWQKLLDYELPELPERERAYIDGPVEALCAASDDWQVHQIRDLPEDAWALIRKHRLFGMIIPEE